MKKLFATLCFIMFSAIGLMAQNADDEKPIITFKTNIYNNYGPSNSFHLVIGTTKETYIDVDCGHGKDEYLVKPATFNADSLVVEGTTVTCNVNADGIVKIYGDASLIDYFDAEGCYIESIDFGDCVNLDILDLQHNELKSLDLSKYRNLSAIYLTDNPFTPETPLVVGPDHPYLTILEVDIIGYLSPDFDITTYTELISFDAYATHTLTHLDPSNCKKLRRLCVDSCPIRELDVTGCPELTILNVEDSGIISLDLSGNPKLTQLYAKKDSGTLNTDRKFTKLDVSKNPLLTYFTAVGNLLTEIDLSANTALDYLNLSRNRLTNIDLSANSMLTSVDISQNNMNFATLPLPDPAWYDYVYEQNAIPVDKSYSVGTVLDFSDKILRENTSTDAVVYAYTVRSNTTRALDSSYFTYENGKVTLNKEVSDSVFISFGNSAFPGVRLTTTMFKIKSEAEFGQPSAILNFSPGRYDGEELDLNIGLEGATTESPRTFMLDLGDGTLQEFKTSASDLSDGSRIKAIKKGSGLVKVYVPEGEILTAFGTVNVPLYAIELKDATELRQLSLESAGLYSIDLAYNRCLRSLDLSDNNLSSLTLAGINGVYEKNVLSDIDLSHNQLTAVTLNDTRTIHSLDLSYNKFAALDYKEFEYIKSFNVSHNELTDINIVYMTDAELIDLSGNRLTSLTLPENYNVGSLKIENNAFTLASLPVVNVPGCAYSYAPQMPIQLPSKAPSADLKAQWRDVDGMTTCFNWQYTDGTPMIEGTDYTGKNGQFAFLEPSYGKDALCLMSHPAFPDFKGEDMLRTTAVEASAKPTNLIASFTTTTAGQIAALSLAAETPGTAVYIDWSGEGYAFEQYLLKDTYTLFQSTTAADANVKVYTYSTDDHITVFSISGVSMADMDASKLVDAGCITVNGAGLSEIKLPKGDKLRELTLDDNNFTEFDLSAYPSLMFLSIGANKLTRLDLSANPRLQLAAAANNNIESVKLSNPLMWQLSLSGNNLHAIDLSGAPGIEQLALDQNQLSAIDLSPLKGLIALDLSRNSFTLATLPPVKDEYVLYNYANQAAMDVECIDGTVDLSSQAKVGDVATDYTWYIGVPEFDQNGNLTGENLYEDDEYTLKDGVTTFLTGFDNVMCVMHNSEFPKLYLYTNPLKVFAGLEEIATDAIDTEAVYYNLSGVRVENPERGNIYIVVRGSRVTKELIR